MTKGVWLNETWINQQEARWPCDHAQDTTDDL